VNTKSSEHSKIEKPRGGKARFNVLAVDEASKTTFHGSIVPTLFAKRWVIVDDPKQLSPYGYDQEMAVNIETCQPNADVSDARVHILYALRPSLLQFSNLGAKRRGLA